MKKLSLHNSLNFLAFFSIAKERAKQYELGLEINSFDNSRVSFKTVTD